MRPMAAATSPSNMSTPGRVTTFASQQGQRHEPSGKYDEHHPRSPSGAGVEPGKGPHKLVLGRSRSQEQTHQDRNPRALEQKRAVHDKHLLARA
jgi:hypothetical protein